MKEKKILFNVERAGISMTEVNTRQTASECYKNSGSIGVLAEEGRVQLRTRQLTNKAYSMVLNVAFIIYHIHTLYLLV